jgi:hypothetical protein
LVRLSSLWVDYWSLLIDVDGFAELQEVGIVPKAMMALSLSIETTVIPNRSNRSITAGGDARSASGTRKTRCG